MHATFRIVLVRLVFVRLLFVLLAWFAVNAPSAQAASSPQDQNATERNVYGVMVDELFRQAYQAHFAGDGPSALLALDQLNATPTGWVDSVKAWHVVMFRAQVLTRMGRATEVESLLKTARQFELEYFGSLVFSDTLQAQAWVWLGDDKRAKELFLRTAEWFEQQRVTLRVPLESVAFDPGRQAYHTHAKLRTYTGLASLALLDDQASLAKQWAAQAEAVHAAAFPAESQTMSNNTVPAEADLLRALNWIYLGASIAIHDADATAAAGFFERADEFYARIGHRPGLVTSLSYQSYAALRAGQFDAAAKLGTQVVELASELGLPDLIWRMQTLMGEGYLKAGQRTEAERAFRQAQAAVDLVNGSLASDRAKLQFGVGKARITQRLVEFDLKSNNPAQLFEDAERGRARAFVDLLTHTELGLTDNFQTNERVRSLDEKIRILRLRQSLQHGESIAASRRDIDTLMASRNELMDQLAAVNTEWSAAYSVRYGSLEAVQKRLQPADLLVYALATTQPSDIHLMFVRSSSVQFKTIRNGNPGVLAALVQLTDGVALGDVKLQTHALSQLTKVLDTKNWPKATHVYMVPTGQFHSVPWSALGLGRWVSVLPNASWLLRGVPPRHGNTGQLVVGDPDFSGALPQLPGARIEADQVSRQYRVEPLLGKQATTTAIFAQARQKLGVLHLATHGVFDQGEPLKSALFFSKPGGGAQAMTAEDVFRQPVRADLVVLSACETGVGQVQADNDLLGLQRSFYMNGATQMVNTLWPVSDGAAQAFMTIFHANLHLGTGEAIRAAVDSTRKAGHPPSVYAAFVLNGYTAPGRKP